jgi:NHL repeat/IPT/TIG domain
MRNSRPEIKGKSSKDRRGRKCQTGRHLRRVCLVAATSLSLLAFAGVAAAATQVTVGSSFDLPYGVAVDHSGNVYIAILGHGRIVKVNPRGVQSTFASGFVSLTGLAVDASGNVYLADSGINQVERITPDGVQTTIGSGFNQPNGVAVDSSGDVYVADSGNSRVEEVTPEGSQTTIGSGFAGPNGVAVDSSGNVYVTDALAGRVVEIGSPPSVTRFSPTSGPAGTVVTINGTNLFAASKVTINGVTATLTRNGATEIKITVPAEATTGKIKVIIRLGTARTASAFTVT